MFIDTIASKYIKQNLLKLKGEKIQIQSEIVIPISEQYKEYQ